MNLWYADNQSLSDIDENIILLEKPVDQIAPKKTNIISLPRRNGSIDVSKYGTDDTFYEDGTIDFEFIISATSYDNFVELRNKINALLYVPGSFLLTRGVDTIFGNIARMDEPPTWSLEFPGENVYRINYPCVFSPTLFRTINNLCPQRWSDLVWETDYFQNTCFELPFSSSGQSVVIYLPANISRATFSFNVPVTFLWNGKNMIANNSVTLTGNEYYKEGINTITNLKVSDGLTPSSIICTWEALIEVV